MSSRPETVADTVRFAMLRRMPEWLVVVCIGVLAAAVFTIPYLFHPLFYYVGDNPESFVPVWHHLGEQLRAGHWPTMDPAGWYGGNYAADTEYSLWNPFGLVNYLIVAGFDNLATAAAVVQIEFLAIIAMGVYLLAREYGARRVPAVVVALAMPACGYTMYYAASGWPAELTALAFTIWFWWAARRMTRGRLTPIVPFLIGVLAVMSGNPYAALGMIIVLLGIGVELLLRKDYRALWHLVIMGGCAGSTALLTFLPLVGAMPVSTRQTLAVISNDMFMVPHLSDVAASSAPSYLPPIVNWGGAVLENLPSTYFVWFAIPLLPWLRWRTLRRPVRPLASLFVVAGLFGILTFGPSNLWLFRWPIRLIEYLYVGLAVLVAVLISAGLARDHIRERALASAAVVAAGAYLSFALRPKFYTIHTLATVIVAVLVAAALWAYFRRGWTAFGAVLLLGTIGVLTFQTARLPVLTPGAGTVYPPDSVSHIEAGASQYQGTILQLASQTGVTTDQQSGGELLFGNLSLVTGHEAINRYSGIGYDKFANALCMDYKGVTCPGLYDRLWQPVAGTNIPLVDALRVQTLVIQHSLLPSVAAGQPRQGWHVVARDDVRTVWVRDAPLPFPGRVSGVSDGVTVRSSDSQYEQETVHVQVPDGGGTVTFARLDWPGYTATVDGSPATLREDAIGLLTAELPAGSHTLVLSYADPGVKPGSYVLIAAGIVVLAQSVFWWRQQRRDRRSPGVPTGPDTIPAESDTEVTAVLTPVGPPSEE